MTLGHRIRAARKRLGLNQREFAEKLDVSTQAVSNWERDEAIPETTRLAPLVKALKVPPMWLLEGDGEPPDLGELERLWNALPPAQQRQAARILQMLADDAAKVA